MFVGSATDAVFGANSAKADKGKGFVERAGEAFKRVAAVMAKWTRVVVQSSEEFSFPHVCPSCLRPNPKAQLQVRSERGRLKGFYLIATKWEHLRITVPFCQKCADRRRSWEMRDVTLLLTVAIASLALSAWLAVWLSLSALGFWGVFLAAAAVFTTLCNLLAKDYRAVQIERHDAGTVTFRFSRSEYAREFARLNGSKQHPSLNG